MLYIYSGDVPRLDQCLRRALGSRQTLLPIPTSPAALGDAHAMADFMRSQGVHARALSARDYSDPLRLHRALSSAQAVFLLGGNTYDFLEYARSVGLFALLTEFEARGGIIASESAGSILLSPSIATAAIPTFEADEHTVFFEDYRAMGRIPFHISPHYDPLRRQAAQDLLELRTLAHATRTPVLVLRDREGVVMEGTRVTQVIGHPLWLRPDQAPPATVELPDWTLAPTRLHSACNAATV
ncbi:MAG: Type 1 glutamine amidotransferase-like domain-containing protein [Gammaproteobacteria bacterium]|nr:Type 1 glutamine amidotransferase-like domain-containing protein [Gammaproteobacteria bacterium]